MKSKYKLVSIEALAPTIHTYIFQPNDIPLPLIPGQYLSWQITETQALPCSVAAQDNQGTLTLHLRQYPLLQQAAVKPGSIFQLEGPFGHCTVTQPLSTPLLFIAGGTGYAPYHALLPFVLQNQLAPSVTLYWGSKIRADWYAWNTLMTYTQQYSHFQFIPVLSQPDVDWQGKIGLVHEAVLQDFESLQDHTVFASGPWPMIQMIEACFLAHGLPRERLFSDFLP